MASPATWVLVWKLLQKCIPNWGRLGERVSGENQGKMSLRYLSGVLRLYCVLIRTEFHGFGHLSIIFLNATHMNHAFSCMQIPLGWKGYVSQWTLLTASTLDHSPRPGSSVYLCVHLQPRHHHISPWLRSYIPSHVSTFDTDLNTPPFIAPGSSPLQ